MTASKVEDRGSRAGRARALFPWPLVPGPWPLFAAFAISLLLGLGAIAWITSATLRLDRSEAEIRRQSALEENVRLALWRMDTALAPLIAQPMLSGRAQFVLAWFQFDSDGRLTTQALSDAGPGIAKVGRLSEIMRHDALLASLPEAPAAAETPLTANTQPGDAAVLGVDAPPVELAQQQQIVRSNAEFQRRSQYLAQNSMDLNVLQTTPQAPSGGSAAPFSPLWLGNELILARRGNSSTGNSIEGYWLDWASLQAWLRDLARDLLPSARLEPVGRVPADGQARILAALPVRLVPGQIVAPPDNAWSPLRLSLVVAWACVLLAVCAVAVMLFGVWSLSERRAAFVSAVTHELRTPLTTFRLYTEMLGEGMVADDARRREYLRTLATEADRLSHLVENILSYARLERGQPHSHCEIVPLSQMLERVTPRLSDRARQAEMELVVNMSRQVLDATVQADVSAVEQILFNLVDNACKYAAGADDRRIRFEAEAAGNHVLLRIRDHGPGLDRTALSRLFRPFNKSSRDAANSAPGVGLGLALSRRYARAMGGELTLERSENGGAAFALRLVRGPAATVEC